MARSPHSKPENTSAVASRRALLAGAAGAAGALAVETVARAPIAIANTGNAVLAGKSNNADTVTTLRNDGIFNSASLSATGLVVIGGNANHTDGSTCFAGPVTGGTGILSTGGSAGDFCSGPEAQGGTGI